MKSLKVLVVLALTVSVSLGGSAANAHYASVSPLAGQPQVASTTPPPRSGAAMAYDAATGSVVLFGGEGPDGDRLADTWTWDGTNWTQQSPSVAPPPDYEAAMAYDAARGEIVLLSTAASTWTWNGTSWSEQHPTSSPPQRSDAAIAYDAAHGVIVLFSGLDLGTHDVNARGHVNDTWTWDGTTWSQQTPDASPPAVIGANMVNDDALPGVVLFGGLSAEGFYAAGLQGAYPGATWIWNGATWSNTGTKLPAVDLQNAAYDATHRVVVATEGVLGGTWTWDGDLWALHSPQASPPPRQEAAVAFAGNLGVTVLFGGSGSGVQTLGDTWIWDGCNWTNVTSGTITPVEPCLTPASVYSH